MPEFHRYVKVVKNKACPNRQQRFQPKKRLRPVSHERNRLRRGNAQPAHEGGEATLQAGHRLVRTGKYPYFPIDFSCAGENLEIPPRSPSNSSSVASVETERY